MKKQQKEQKGKIEELTNDLKRVQAEFENFKKRFEKEKGEFVMFANAKLVSEFLPVLDSMDDALKHAKEEEKKGIEGIKMQLMQVLERNGVKAIETEGKMFDHEFHEVFTTVCIKEKENGIILEEFQKGYLLNGKVLRHSKVKVNKLEGN